MNYDNTWGFIVLGIILCIFICSWKMLNCRNRAHYQETNNEEQPVIQPVEQSTNHEEQGVRTNTSTITETTPVIDKEEINRERLYTIYEY